MSEIILYARDGAFTEEQRERINSRMLSNPQGPANPLGPVLDYYNSKKGEHPHIYSSSLPQGYVHWHTEYNYFKDNVVLTDGEITHDYCIVDLSAIDSLPANLLSWLWARMSYVTESQHPRVIAREFLSISYLDPRPFNLLGYYRRDVASKTEAILTWLVPLLREVRSFFLGWQRSCEPSILYDSSGLLIITTADGFIE